MSAEGPPPAGGSNWNRAALKPPPRGLVMMALAIGAAIAVGLLGWSGWYVFDNLNRTAHEMEALAATAANIDTHCDAGDTPAKAGEPMSEGKCIPDEFRFVVTDGTVEEK